MTASRADVQAKLDAVTADLGAVPPNIPDALSQIAAARTEVGLLNNVGVAVDGGGVLGIQHNIPWTQLQVLAPPTE